MKRWDYYKYERAVCLPHFSVKICSNWKYQNIVGTYLIAPISRTPIWKFSFCMVDFKSNSKVYEMVLILLYSPVQTDWRWKWNHVQVLSIIVTWRLFMEPMKICFYWILSNGRISGAQLTEMVTVRSHERSLSTTRWGASSSLTCSHKVNGHPKKP